MVELKERVRFIPEPGQHGQNEISGHVIGRCKGRTGWFYDVLSLDGERFDNVPEHQIKQQSRDTHA